MSVNIIVLFLNILGACIASAGLVPLRQVANMTQIKTIRHAWTAMFIVMIICIVLLIVAAAGSVHKKLDSFDLAATGIHVLGPCFVFGVAWLSQKTAQHILHVEAIGRSAFVDSLTGVGNRRLYDVRIAEEIDRARTQRQPLSLLIFDIDHFKNVNDSFGHSMGDVALKHVAEVAASKTRNSDTLCRIGGEEFVVIMPGIEGAYAVATAERLRRAIAEAGVATGGGEEVRITVSLGLAALRIDDDAHTFTSRADTALYDAKRGGRNRLCLAA